MKSKKIFVAIAVSTFLATLGSSAFADEKYRGELASNWKEHITSTKSRAQVIAELEQARANGQPVGASPFYPEHVVTPIRRSRAEVIAELEQARANGQPVGASPFYPERVVTPIKRSRAEVIAELEQAAQNRNSGPDSLYFGD
jgi:hypothetical protein